MKFLQPVFQRRVGASSGVTPAESSMGVQRTRSIGRPVKLWREHDLHTFVGAPSRGVVWLLLSRDTLHVIFIHKAML